MSHPICRLAKEVLLLIRDLNDEESTCSSLFVKLDHPKTPEYSNGSKVIFINKFDREEHSALEQSIQEVLKVEESSKEAKNKLAKVYTIYLEHVSFLAKW